MPEWKLRFYLRGGPFDRNYALLNSSCSRTLTIRARHFLGYYKREDDEFVWVPTDRYLVSRELNR